MSKNTHNKQPEPPVFDQSIKSAFAGLTVDPKPSTDGGSKRLELAISKQ